MLVLFDGDEFALEHIRGWKERMNPASVQDFSTEVVADAIEVALIQHDFANRFLEHRLRVMLPKVLWRK